MTLGHGNISDDIGEALNFFNKIAKVFGQGKLWTKNRDGKLSITVGDIFTSKEELLNVIEELLNVMKDYCIQHSITLRKIKNTRSRYI